MTYRPAPSSLAARVIDYLTRNPEASLTVSEIVSRFVGFADMRNVHDQLVTACDFDYLEWHPRKDTGGTYCLGPERPPPLPEDRPLPPRRSHAPSPGVVELCSVLPFGNRMGYGAPAFCRVPADDTEGGAL
ncbi:hypothetical protein [Paracidovorax anthurii]|uniref:Uncharacterized protein n=1 Tax=Paracidovorax anthurii TaxID=78229 RepID=A0A328ZGL6_9BURK|nr:hypothetical protein [Paracidovorax anthurii]RAR84999.1 hypothetical protein AX018_100892 [Paracidovorax anthurii]